VSPASENLNVLRGRKCIRELRKVLAHSPAATSNLWGVFWLHLQQAGKFAKESGKGRRHAQDRLEA